MSERPPPTVSVVIPHYNQLEALARCLAALSRQTMPRERFEVIVADNNSAGGIEAVAAIAPDATVVAAPQQGAGPARNVGAAQAQGAALAFVDADCLPEADWLAEGMAALDRFDYAGGRVVTTIADRREPSPAEAYEAVFAFDFRKYIEKDKFSGS